MKQVSKILLSFGLLASLTLMGCGAQENQSDKSGQNNVNTTQEEPTEVFVSAAASLKASLTELQEAYAQKNPDVKLTINFSGSGTLQQQIEQGAPADLFISAGKSQMDKLVEKDLMVKDSVVNLLGNELVLITQKDNQKFESIQELNSASVEQIGVGTPQTVPAGKYAQESLTTLKLWDTLQPKYVFAKDVNQLLSYVETGNVDAGILYKSDALVSDKVKIVESFPADSYKPIVYPAGIVAATKDQEVTAEFLKYLQSEEAQKVFEKYGFKSGM